MQYIKRILCVSMVIAIICAITAPCFSIAAGLTAGASFGFGASAYAAASGFSIETAKNGMRSDIFNPMNRNSWKDMHHSLYSEYYSSKSASEVERLGLFSPSNWDLNYNNTDWYDKVELWTTIENAYQENIFATVTFDSSTTEIYDDYYNWILGTKLGLTKDSTTGVWLLPNTSYEISENVTNSLESQFAPVSSDINNKTWLYTQSNNTVHSAYTHSTGNDVFVALISAGTNIGFVFVSSASSKSVIKYAGNSYSTLNLTHTYEDIVYYTSNSNGGVQDINPLLPYFNTLDEALAVANSLISEGDIEDTLLISSNTGVVDIPDNSDQNYTPAPLPIPLNTPYDQSIDVIQEDSIDQILGNELEIVDTTNPDTPPGGETVVIPFLGIELPSFNLGLSGIWHYVVEWVSSIGSGSALIFNIWSALPYAMIVPIYASAVVVIVIGMFKRFFQ